MRWIFTTLIALAAGLLAAAAWDYSGLGPDRTREDLLANPEMLREAMVELQRREMAAQVEPLRAELEAPFPGALLGNPNGSITLVEFTDYACTYCRASLADVNALIAANRDVKVVIREYPILSQGSVEAALMALAAAEQGRYAAFHNAMYAAEDLSAANIARVAENAGIDLARAQQAINSGRFDRQLDNNRILGQSLGLTGTPAWVVGDQVLSGAVGRQLLADAIAEARDS